MALTPEILIPRLGDTLVELGLLTNEQLNKALERQNVERSNGKSPLIGQILVEMGFIAKPTLDQAITNQVLKLQNALKQSNQNLERRVQERTFELEVAYKKLSELTNLKANFISNISHELRTPLTHVKGYVELLLTKSFGEISEDQVQALTVIKRASERLGRLIDDLILFSTAETASLQIQKTDIDLRPLVEQVLARNLPVAEQKKIRLWLDCIYEHIIISADSDRLLWVINQLVDNALKFSNNGSEVIIRIDKTENESKISIIDTGIGIETNKINEIFEPFHQLDGSTTRQYGGTGIGLTLVKKIIEAHGSKITVNSVPGKGSVFEFSLPLNNL